MNSRTDRIRKAYCELYYENGEPSVHCKEFKVKRFEMSKSTFDDLPNLDKNAVEVLKGKNIKVIITPSINHSQKIIISLSNLSKHHFLLPPLKTTIFNCI